MCRQQVYCDSVLCRLEDTITNNEHGGPAKSNPCFFKTNRWPKVVYKTSLGRDIRCREALRPTDIAALPAARMASAMDPYGLPRKESAYCRLMVADIVEDFRPLVLCVEPLRLSKLCCCAKMKSRWGDPSMGRASPLPKQRNQVQDKKWVQSASHTEHLSN